MDRFHASMTALHLDPKMAREAIQTAITDMVADLGFCNSYVAMVCSRAWPKYPAAATQGSARIIFYAGCVPYAWVISPAGIEPGASACLATSVQRIPDGSLTPLVKTYPGATSHAGGLRPKKRISKGLSYRIRQVM